MSVRARFGERKYRSLQARMIFFQPTPQGPGLAAYAGHGTTFAGWEIKYTVVCFAWSVAILFLICSPLPDKRCIFAILISVLWKTI